MRHPTPAVTRRRTLRTALLSCSLALGGLPAVATAQEARIYTMPDLRRRIELAADRPMIGVTTTSASERGDTLGLRIESVTTGSPADKAGLKAGDRLQAVNGVSLRADRADAGEDDYDGVLNRRLQREVQRTASGESVELRVLSGSQARTVRVTPVKASEFQAESEGTSLWRSRDRDGAVLGVTVASTGSARDTLGVFVQAVVKDGPAEKAGIVEGDRIAAINSVSLRVAREDAEDDAVGAARAERLSREVAKLKAGDVAELTVISAGRSRTVRVTTVKAGDLPGGAAQSLFFRIPEPGGMPFEESILPRLRFEERGLPRFRMEERELPRERIEERERPRLRIQRPSPGTLPLVIRRSVRTEV